MTIDTAAGPHGHAHGHPGGLPGVGAVKSEGYVYDRAPMLIYWETTLACGLACRHCRATAMPERADFELSTVEGFTLLDRITGFGRPYPHIVFTGGDPLKRADLEDLVAGATARGIGSSLAPAVTPDFARERLASLQAAGIQTVGLSLDGSTPARHDGLRMVPGTFDATIAALRTCADLGLPVQINTLVTDQTLDDLPAIYEVLTRVPVMRWSLFFLISIGRGTALTEISPGEAERLYAWLYELAKTAPFQVKTTEAMSYRRVAINRAKVDGLTNAEIRASSVGRGFGIRDGNGIMFINHKGEVHPSGFLPYVVGNVRTDDVVDLYRKSEVFTQLRDITAFAGRCGDCEYARYCGGSRARAFAWTGDMLAADPLCPYHPHEGAPDPLAAAPAPQL